MDVECSEPCISEVCSLLRNRMQPNTQRALICAMRVYPRLLVENGNGEGDASRLMGELGIATYIGRARDTCSECSPEAIFALAFYAAAIARGTPLRAALEFIAANAGRVHFTMIREAVGEWCRGHNCDPASTYKAVAFLFAMRKLSVIDGMLYPRAVYSWTIKTLIPEDAFTILEACTGLELAEYIAGVASNGTLCTHILKGIEEYIVGP